MKVVLLDLDLTEFWWVGCLLWIWRVKVQLLNLWKIMK